MDFDGRKKYSEKRLGAVEKEIEKLSSVKKIRNLCIFVCGSFGRKEAAQKSDLDLFFINHDTKSSSSRKETTPNKIDETLLGADLIRILRKLEFPEFSNDGEYLKFHSLQEILKNLGGPKDDSSNYFTTRMLLILESTPVYNEMLYEKIITEAIDTYYRDYGGHEEDFRALFLLNDLIRFWKTLCLNYEHRRNEIDLTDPQEKGKHREKNLKLKFSRMTICYSMIIPLSMKNPKFQKKEEVLKLIKMTPFERLERIVEENGEEESKKTFKSLREQYLWFLEEVSKENIRNSLLDERYKKEAFKKATVYSNSIYKLLLCVSDDESRKFLTV